MSSSFQSSQGQCSRKRVVLLTLTSKPYAPVGRLSRTKFVICLVQHTVAGCAQSPLLLSRTDSEQGGKGFEGLGR